MTLAETLYGAAQRCEQWLENKAKDEGAFLSHSLDESGDCDDAFDFIVELGFTEPYIDEYYKNMGEIKTLSLYFAALVAEDEGL